MTDKLFYRMQPSASAEDEPGYRVYARGFGIPLVTRLPIYQARDLVDFLLAARERVESRDEFDVRCLIGFCRPDRVRPAVVTPPHAHLRHNSGPYEITWKQNGAPQRASYAKWAYACSFMRQLLIKGASDVQIEFAS